MTFLPYNCNPANNKDEMAIKAEKWNTLVDIDRKICYGYIRKVADKGYVGKWDYVEKIWI